MTIDHGSLSHCVYLQPLCEPVTHWAGPGDCIFYGANMAFRQSLIDPDQQFREDIGVKGTERTVGEENSS